MNVWARSVPNGELSAPKRLAVGAALVAGGVLFTEVVLPKATPAGIVLRGGLAGTVDALLAVGLVLIWRSARVINFAQAALGGAAAYAAFALVAFFGVPFLLVLPVVVLVGAVTGALVDAVFVQRFFNASRLVLTVVTIVVARFLADSRGFVNAIPPIRDHARSIEGSKRLATGELRLPFPDFEFHVSFIRFGSGTVIEIVAASIAFVALAVWLRTSRIGTAVRGVAVNAERAQSLGINVRLVGTIVWAIAGALAALAAVLRPLGSDFRDVGLVGPDVLLPALAAAVLAGMRSIPRAALAAVAIGIGSQAVLWSYPTTGMLKLALVGVIGVGLLLQRTRKGRSEDGGTSSWEASKEVKPIPRELVAVPEVRRARIAVVAALAVVVFVLPFASSSAQTNLGSLILIQGIVALSLVVLTGWAGQISLGQFALVAVAAVVGGNLTAVHHLSFWLALPLVAVMTGALAAALAVPALRVKGPFLAVTTLAFAIATEQTLFRSRFFTDLIPPRVDRPRLLFVSFSSERSYYFLCLAFVVAAALVVDRLRKSRTGRVLIAGRDNEAGVQSFGVALAKTRIAAFAVSGALCGIAGLLFVHHQRAIDATSYASSVSVDMFIMTMIGGIGTVAGGLLGAAYIGIVTFVVPSALVRNLATSGGLLVLLLVAPGGLASLLANARDHALRIVAARNGIVVPSLFADADYTALVAKQAPISARIPFRGLEAIPAERRYALGSELHGQGARVLAEVP